MKKTFLIIVEYLALLSVFVLVFLFFVKPISIVAADDCGDCPAGYYCKQNNNGSYSCKPNPTARPPTTAPTHIPTTIPTHIPTTAPTQPGGGGGGGSTSCQACSTGACGQCSNYASGWRCKCTGLQGNGYYTSCIGHLDSSCGVAQPTPTGIPPGMCNYCSTGACGQCSNYASGWRCNCYDKVGDYYKTCVGELDITCGVAQPTPTPPCSKRYTCNLSSGLCKETQYFYTNNNIQCNATATCEENLAATQNNGTTGTCYDDMTICQKSCCPKKINGDADCDGVVTLKDYLYFFTKKSGGQLPASVNVDFNTNGTVDDADRAIVITTLKQ